MDTLEKKDAVVDAVEVETKKRGRPKKERKGPVIRSAAWCLELYPDNEQHAAALETIKAGHHYCAMLHDKDRWTEEDQSENPEHVAGELKKAHWHVILKFPNSVYNTSLSEELGLELRFLQRCRNLRAALRYPTHIDYPDKYQYDAEDAIGTMGDELADALSAEPSEGERVAVLLDYISSLDRPVSTSEFARYCALNGYWDVFRRAGAIFCRVLTEHNADIERAEFKRRRDGEYAAAVDRARFDGFVDGHNAQIHDI